MVNVTKLLVDKKIPITRGNCSTLDWFIYIKTEPLEDEHSRDIYLRLFTYVSKGDSPHIEDDYIEYEFRQYNLRLGTWGKFTLFIKTTYNIWSQDNATIVDAYIKSPSGVTAPLNIKGRLYSMLVSHSALDDDGDIFQLYFSGSELEIDLENYKEVNLQ